MVRKKLTVRRGRKNADSPSAHTEVAAAYCRAEGSPGVGQFTLATAWRKSSLLAPGSKPRQTAALFLTQEKEDSKQALYSSVCQRNRYV